MSNDDELPWQLALMIASEDELRDDKLIESEAQSVLRNDCDGLSIAQRLLNQIAAGSETAAKPLTPARVNGRAARAKTRHGQ